MDFLNNNHVTFVLNRLALMTFMNTIFAKFRHSLWLQLKDSKFRRGSFHKIATIHLDVLSRCVKIDKHVIERMIKNGIIRRKITGIRFKGSVVMLDEVDGEYYLGLVTN